MVDIILNPQTLKVEIKFGGVNFHDLLDLCKEENLTYLPNYKKWSCEPKKFIDKNLLNLFQGIESASISKTELSKIQEACNKTEIKRQRIRYNEDIVNFKPLEGIPPNETYQLDDIKRFLAVNRGGVYWEQRLGKAVWLAVHMTHLFYYNKVDKAVILTPSSGVYNTKSEILFFSKLFKDEDIVIADKDNREPFNSEAKIVIMTYRTFLLISDHYYKKKNKKSSKKYYKPVIPFLDWGENRVIYADESQELGNPTSRQSKVAHMHKHYFEYRYTLSGTPGATVEKYYSQIRFLDENIIPYSYQDFLGTIGNIGNRFSKYALNYLYPDKVKVFLESIEPYLSRRLLKDHLEISEDYIKRIYVPLNKKQKYIYEELTKTVIKELKESDEGKLSLQRIKSKFPYISLALQDPKVLINSFKEKEVYNSRLLSTIENWKFEDNSKLEVMDDLVYRTLEEQEKLIIWGGHPNSLDELAERYKKYNPLVVHGLIKEKGKTTEQLKAEAVKKFIDDNSVKILITNYMSLSTQVNLTICHTQIYWDRGYDLIPWSQSRKRIQGSKQTYPTTTYVLIIKNTLDEEQDLILKNKSMLNKHAFDRDTLSLEEWKQLFNGKGV